MGNAITAAVHHVEQADGLDRPVALYERALAPLGRPGPLRDLLTGRWMGHAAHPLLTDLPIGFWTSATFVDLVGGRAARPVATRLLGAGNLAAVPAAVTGMAEWVAADPVSKRIGVVHANSNAVGLALYSASYVARRRGRHGWGAALALGGMAVASVAGYLGGHLAVARKVGTASSASDAPARDHSPAKTSSP